MASSEIQVRNLSFKVGSETILRDVNLQISSGECFVLLGPSGLGKSLLLKMIAGLSSPTTGEITIGGQNLWGLHGVAHEKILQQMGMLFQKNALFDSLSVSENLAFAMREISHLNEAEIEASIRTYLSAVGLLDSRDLFPDEMSGGMQKRLGIARALVLRPKILLLDDPTAGLDPITSRKIVDLILNLKVEFGCTILAVTNEMPRAFQMADRIGMIIDKSLLITGTVAETRAHKDLRVQQFIRGDLQGPLSFEGRSQQ